MPSARAPRPAAFLDRDGVLNADLGYAYKPGQLRWIDGAPAAVRMLNQAGYFAIVVTNQSGVARGYFEESDVMQLHDHMREVLRAQGAIIDAFYYCPHHPEGKIEALTRSCHCRKPAPGMLEQAAREWPIERAGSFLIGDKDSDMAAAQAFNIRGVKFNAANQSLTELVQREIAAKTAGGR